MNSNKKRKKLLVISSVLFVTIFLVVFLINYSFAGVKSHRLSIPKSTCQEKNLPLTEQGSNCEERKFFEDLARDYSLEDIYEVWGAFTDEQQEVVFDYLQNNDMIKYTELDNLIKNIKAKKMTETIDDNEVTVITEIPKNTSIEVVKTDKDKIDIIEDTNIGIVNDNNYVESYTYDISMNNNKTNYVNNDALITISDIKATTKKKYYVYHLLDSVEAINDYKDNKNLITIDSDKLTGDFSEELKAAKAYSDVDNRIYVLLEEANINNDGSISFKTNSFSTFHVVGYTVDFHYDGMTYSINGETSVLLSQVFEKLKIDKDVSKIVSVTFTDEELVKVTKTENDWMLTSLKAFDTNEVLTMFFEDGEMFTLDVTDDAVWTMFDSASSYFEGGEALYKISGNSGDGKSEWNLHILSDATGNSSPSSRSSVANFSDTANNLRTGGTQYKLVSPKYWFYSARSSGYGALRNGNNGVNDIDMYNVSIFNSSRLKIDVYAVPTLIYSSSEYGTLRQASAHSLGYQYRTVKYYVNKNDDTHLITTWNGIMPDRNSDSDNNCGLNANYSPNLLLGTYNSSYYPLLGDGCNSTGVYDGFNVELNSEQQKKYYFSLTDFDCRRMDFDNGIFLITIFSKVYINFLPNNGVGNMNQQEFVYDKYKSLSKNTFTREGYTFKEWNTKADGTGNRYSDEVYISFNDEEAGKVINLYAQWLGNPMDYVVNHYKQKLDGTYELNETETISGKRVGDQTAATAKNYDGFSAKSFNQVEIGTNGATVNIYYDRNSYDFYIYHKDNTTNQEILSSTGSSTKVVGTATFGSTVSVSDYIKNDLVGYKFINSSGAISSNNIVITSNESSNTADIYYQYTEVPYTVNYYQKDIGANTYTKVSSDSYIVNGKLHDNITYNTKTYPGFKTIPEKVEYIDTNNNSSKVEESLKEVNVYYDRYIYTVEYSYSGTVPANAPEVPIDNAVEYGNTITLPVISLEGYDFSWDKSSPLTVTSNVNVVGTFTPKNDAFYRVRYYLKGTTTEIKSMDENLNAEYNKKYTIEAPKITGYTLDNTSPKTVTAGYAGSNNEIHFEYSASKVNYTVNYCLKNISGNGCTNQSVTLEGNSLDPISYEQKTIEGFTFDRVENNSNGIINPDGSTIVTVYYTRNSHNLIVCVTKDDNDTYNNCNSINYKYGETIEPLTEPGETNYTFSGWVVNTPEFSSIPSTMPDHDLNVTGTLERKREDLTIISNWSDNIIGKVSSITITDSDNNSLNVVTDNSGKVIVKNLAVGKTYTIVETSCDVGYTCDNYVTHTMTIENNTVTFNNTLNSTNKGWLKSTNRNKNIFGAIQ